MIVCLCRAVSDRVVRLAVVGGAQTLKQVRAACDAGRGCGSCHEEIEKIIATQAGAGGAAARAGARDCLGESLPVPSADNLSAGDAGSA